MKKLKHLLFILTLLVCSTAINAQTLVLVQGYLGDGQDWRSSGLASRLVKAGWVDAGHLRWLQGQVSNKGYQDGQRRFYTLSLPSESGMMQQLPIFADYIKAIQEVHPDESIILAGHSAGGVLARLYMVQHPKAPVKALVTISSPHLGTELAEIGSMIGQSPLGWMAPLMGASELTRSRNLFSELAREKPGNFLYWLNRQAHPESDYISVIRAAGKGFSGDLVVPSWSQDMNNVHALRGRSERYITNTDHGLTLQDGDLLVEILGAETGGELNDQQPLKKL